MIEREGKGKFIVFEGIGGSGKSTQIGIAKALLESNGFSVVATREPGGVEAAEEIRKLIFQLRERKLIGPEGQLALFFASRKLWMEKLVIPNIEKGVHVLSDRCHTSTGAYQGYAEGGNMDQILEISDVVLGKYKPDAVILLDVSKGVSWERRGNDTNGDPFDKETSEYYERLIAGYREMAEKGWGGLKWYLVNGGSEVEIVSDSIASVLEEIFGQDLQK